MSMSMSMPMSMYVSISMSMPVSISMSVPMSISVSVHVHMDMRMHMYMYMHAQVYMPVHVDAFGYGQVDAHVHGHLHGKNILRRLRADMDIADVAFIDFKKLVRRELKRVVDPMGTTLEDVDILFNGEVAFSIGSGRENFEFTKG